VIREEGEGAEASDRWSVVSFEFPRREQGAGGAETVKSAASRRSPKNWDNRSKRRRGDGATKAEDLRGRTSGLKTCFLHALMSG